MPDGFLGRFGSLFRVMRESLHPYTLPMAGGGRREGVLVRYVEENSAVGWGDTSPLPGWSGESLEDVIALRDVPSLRCGREAALASIQGFASWPRHHLRVPLNAMLDGDRDAMVDQAQVAADEGCQCFKIKTRGHSLDALCSVLDAILNVAGRDVQLRLDPNRGWEFSKAIEITKSLRGYPIQYIEEPLQDSGRLMEFIGASCLPVALDETLREISPDELEKYLGAAALVLKPTLMGGFERARDFAHAGAVHGMLSAVSACFESGVGIYSLGRFAASLEKCAAAGLDTYSRLEGDVLESRLSFPGYCFDATQCMPPIDRHVIAF